MVRVLILRGVVEGKITEEKGSNGFLVTTQFFNPMDIHQHSAK